MSDLDEALALARHHYGMYEQAQALAVRLERERDEARAEVVRLGKENEEHQRTIRSWRAAQEADEAETAAWLKRVNEGLIAALGAAVDAEPFEERIERIKTRAKEMVEARGVRARLEEERIEPDPVCPAHGEHPHTFGPLEEPRRCLDCPVCACLYVEYPEHAAGPCVLCGWRKP